MPHQDVRGRIGPVLLAVDAVVDHAHARGIDRGIAGQDVARLLARDGDDRVGALQRGALAEAGERVAAPELLLLPRPHRLQRVHGRDVRNAVQELGQVPGEVGVPGVAVHERGALDPRRHREVDRDGLERRGVRAAPGQGLPGPIGAHRGGSRDLFALAAPAVHRQLGEPRELAREVLDVHARAAVDLRRVLPREQRDLQRASTFSPLPITTMPPSETVKRSRSAFASTPM